MVLWGAIWGAILGFYIARNNEGFGLFVGALLGALAGLTLRNAVRTTARQATLEAEQQPTLPLVRDAATATGDVVTPVAPIAAEAGVATPQPADAVSTTDWSVDMPIHVPKDAVADSATIPSEFHDTQSGTAQPDKPQRQPEFPTVQTPDFVSRAFGVARDWLLGGNTIVRMGVLVLFVGLAFLAKYAIDNAIVASPVRVRPLRIA